MAATSFGSSAILIGASMVYTKGLPGLWYSLSVALGFAASGIWFAGRVRATEAHSLADFIGRTHGEGVRRLVSALLVVVQVGFFALTVKSFALLTKPVMADAIWIQQHPQLYLSLICGVFVAYPLLGGQKADVFSNMIKIAAVSVVLLGILLPMALTRISAQGLWQNLPRGWWAFPISKLAGPVYVLNMLVLMGLPGIVGGDVFATILSARDQRAARRGMLLAGLVRALLALGIALLALGARVILPELTGESINLAVPLLARELLPGALFQILTLIFMVSLIATGDTVLLTASTVLSLDVFKLGERAALWRVRLITLGLAVAGLVLAIWLQDLLAVMMFSYTLLCAAIIMPVLGMLVLGGKRGLSTPWVVASIIAGLVGAVGWKLLLGKMDAEAIKAFPYALDPATVGVAFSAVMVAAGALATRYRSGFQPLEHSSL